MVKRRKPAGSKVTSTDKIDVSFGAFSISPDYRVPYMSALLRFQQAAEYLSLVTDDPTYAKNNWTIEELFQREVDQGRVQEIALKYLNPKASRAQFFNSLTVVLRPSPRFDSSQLRAPVSNGSTEYPRQKTVGPLLVEWDDDGNGEDFPEAGGFGSIQWNRAHTYAVAIDGQHRLAAIQHFWRLRHLREAALASYISVIFVVIDPALGFKCPRDQDPLTVMRSIFIDLNKHAVPVSRARNILLDDRDPRSLFVRSLMGNELRYEPTKVRSTLAGSDKIFVGKAAEFERAVPLSLVDWHGESKSKIEAGPYVASVLSLDWIVKKLLSSTTRYPKLATVPAYFDPDADGDMAKIRRCLKSWKGTWKSQNLQKRIQEAQDEGLAFSLTSEDLSRLKEEFSDIWGRAIIRCIVGTAGYRRVVDMRSESNTLTPEFAQWYQAEAAEIANRKNSAVASHYSERLREVEKGLQEDDVSIGDFRKLVTNIEKWKNGDVFFYLVGQRALILALVTLSNSRRAVEWSSTLGIKLSKTNGIQDFYATFLSTALNALYDAKLDSTTGKKLLFDRASGLSEKRASGLLEKRSKLMEGLSALFWAGSLVNKDSTGNMDFSEAAAVRGARWLVLVVQLYWRQIVTGRVVQLSDLRTVLFDEKSVLDEGPFATELREAVVDVRGSFDGDIDYNSPIRFLVGSDGNRETQNEATLERIKMVIRLLETIPSKTSSESSTETAEESKSKAV